MRVITHVALRVPELERAEHVYIGLFDATLLFREAGVGGERVTIAGDWSEARRRGIVPDLAFIRRGALVLALEHDPDPPVERGLVSHIGLGMPPEEVDALVGRARELGCQIIRHDPDAGRALVEDPYGMRWELEGPDMGWATPGDPSGHLDR